MEHDGHSLKMMLALVCKYTKQDIIMAIMSQNLQNKLNPFEKHLPHIIYPNYFLLLMLNRISIFFFYIIGLNATN